jgi:hypothetical protein
MPSSEQVNVKGSMIQATLQVIKDKYGTLAYQKIVDSIQANFKKEIEKGILTGSWYPIELHASIYNVLDKEYAHGNQQYFLEIGRMEADLAGKTVYRFLTKLAGPTLTVRAAKQLWGLTYSASKVEVHAGEKSLDFTILGFPLADKNYIATIAGYIKRSLEIAGAVKVEGTKRKCITQGDEYISFSYKWE